MTHRPDDEKAAEACAEERVKDWHLEPLVQARGRSDVKYGYMAACAHKNAETKELESRLARACEAIEMIKNGVALGMVCVREFSKHQADAEVKS